MGLEWTLELVLICSNMSQNAYESMTRPRPLKYGPSLEYTTLNLTDPKLSYSV